jgi:hypothetical protein
LVVAVSLFSNNSQFSGSVVKSETVYFGISACGGSSSVLSDELLPDELLPDELLPDELLPDELLPDELLPDELLADELLLDELLPVELSLVELLLCKGLVLLSAEAKGEQAEKIIAPSAKVWHRAKKNLFFIKIPLNLLR